MSNYNKVYDFTNENVSCLSDLYNFKSSKVLSIVGSGDQYFTSILNGAKEVDLFDLNSTAYLYFVLKFYAIKELTYEEFYNFFILKNLNDVNVYNKLEPVLPLPVLKYYKYLIQFDKKTKNIVFRNDGINMLSKKTQKYYLNNDKPIIPYLLKDNYYLLKEKLKNIDLPNFYEIDLLNLREEVNKNYDILLASNVFDYVLEEPVDYVNKLKSFDIPEIQVCYDWTGEYVEQFIFAGCQIDKVHSSAQSKYYNKKNYIYSLIR